MDKVINKVYSTNEYSKFSHKKGNRNINPLHLKRIIESMKECVLQTPIIVNEEFEIIDGQHRFEALKHLKKEVCYIVVPNYSLKEIHILNVNNQRWIFKDFLDGYCNLGHQDYIIFRDFYYKYQFGFKECMSLLQNTIVSVGGVSNKKFQNGDFKVKNLKLAEENAEKILQLKPYYEGYKRRVFIHTMLQLFQNKDYVHSSFIEKLQLQPTALKDCVNVKAYLENIEKIYNYKRREKVRLFNY